MGSPGARFGSEADLLSYYGVARPALRQALRLLERQGVIATRQGKAGGIFVARSDPAAALLAFGQHVAPLGVAATHLDEARRAVRAQLVRLTTPLVAQTSAVADAAGFAALADGAGLPIWSLFARALAMRIAREN